MTLEKLENFIKKVKLKEQLLPETIINIQVKDKTSQYKNFLEEDDILKYVLFTPDKNGNQLLEIFN